ncbi:hypothetical protein ALP45_02968 [Pseudomonas coronafaciens pv. atropurpurea]|nr:Uncharacterized protein ALO66_03103 [Pseudomonas coronafaciens pv. atropurpurea]RMT57847.1 hypothetical protein ALP45_02968 [Pseudomonas coronafaciens pv. atropurpurea]
MTLVDHDHETFGGRYNLDISNFQDVIDYGKIMNTSEKNRHNEWVQQVQSNAEKRDSLIFLWLSDEAVWRDKSLATP